MSGTLIAEIVLQSLAATRQFSHALAPLLRQGDILALEGGLGAGKTEMCRAIIHALGYEEDVPSPTFNLVQTYEPVPDDQTTPSVWHMDMYRLESPEEAFELGIDEAFDTALSLIEWPSKLGPYLPPGHLLLKLEISDEKGMRKLTLEGNAHWHQRLAGKFSNV